MCDYCGCRSQPEIAALSADHENILEILGRLERAVRNADRVAAGAHLHELAGLVEPHAQREERGVFRGLRLVGVDDAYVAGFERDHERIHALLQPVSGDGGDSEDWRTKASELVALLADHIFREESDAFPVAYLLIPPAEWDVIENDDLRLHRQR